MSAARSSSIRRPRRGQHGDTRDYNICDANGEYPYGMLALELEKGAFDGPERKFRYSDVYNLDEKEAERFDGNFERKEKGRKPSQDVFSIAIRAYIK